MSKNTKAEVGYISVNNTDFLCCECVYAKSLGGTAFGCALMETASPISMATGSCNSFVHGVRGTELPWIADLSKTELGYAENEYGFGCRRCYHWYMSKRDCDEVDKSSPGDTPGEIAVTACCSAWSPDAKRSKMTTPKLFQLVELSDLGAGRMTADEYRRLKEIGG